MNLLKVPDDLEDKKVVLLSDIMPTGWHGAVLANVQKGDRVAVWGCGPGVPSPVKRPSFPSNPSVRSHSELLLQKVPSCCLI